MPSLERLLIPEAHVIVRPGRVDTELIGQLQLRFADQGGVVFDLVQDGGKPSE